MKTGCNCTIYLLTNKVNNKIYVGQTWLPLHKRMGRNGSNYKNSIYLYAAIQKHGSNNFEYEVLASCEDQDVADKLEYEFINQYDSRNPEIGYNLKEGGSAGRHSEETIKKISQNSARFWLDKNLSEETKQKLSESMSGRTLAPEHREQVIKTLIPGSFVGHEHSDEALTKISDASKNMWESGKMTPESIAKSAKSRRMSSEREQAIIQAYQSGKNISDIEELFETGRSSIYRILDRNNIPRSNNFSKFAGKTHSEETIQKMSDARKDYWNKK